MADDKLKRLLEQRETLNARIRQEQTRLGKEERKKDTRRKILVGAFILDKAEKDEKYNGWLMGSLSGFLTRQDDRALFGLPPVSGSASAPAAVEGKPE